jgi:hypothetical protein
MSMAFWGNCGQLSRSFRNYISETVVKYAACKFAESRDISNTIILSV